MKIGLYQFKGDLRSYLEKWLPRLEGIDPNWISLSLLPLGLFTAWIYLLAAEHSSLYLFGALLLTARLLLGMLDGMVAERYKRVTAQGTLLGSLCPEFADISLLAALALVSNDNSDLAIWALAIGWASSYLGLIGQSLEAKPRTYLGPLDPLDRLVALIIASLLSVIGDAPLWIELFLWWCIFGGLATCGLKLHYLLAPANAAAPVVAQEQAAQTEQAAQAAANEPSPAAPNEPSQPN